MLRPRQARRIGGQKSVSLNELLEIQAAKVIKLQLSSQRIRAQWQFVCKKWQFPPSVPTPRPAPGPLRSRGVLFGNPFPAPCQQNPCYHWRKSRWKGWNGSCGFLSASSCVVFRPRTSSGTGHQFWQVLTSSGTSSGTGCKSHSYARLIKNPRFHSNHSTSIPRHQPLSFFSFNDIDK